MARSLLACAHSTVFRGLLAPFFLAGPEVKGLEAASRVDLKNSRHSDCSDPIFHAGFPTGVIFGFMGLFGDNGKENGNYYIIYDYMFK